MVVRLILVAWATAAAGFDVRYHRLPNWLTLGGLFCGGVYALATGSSMLGGNATDALLAALIGFLVLLPAYLAGWMGAGDVKLFSAMGMLGGGKALLSTLLIGSLVTGIGALMFIMLKKRLALVDVPNKRPLPFGVGLAVGFALSVLDLVPILDWKG